MKSNKQLFLFRVISSPKLISSEQTLTKEKCITNAFRKIETNIYIDLNILSDIRKFISVRNKFEINDPKNISIENNYDNQNIKNVVTLLQGLKEIFLVPGFALSEANEKYKKINYKAFEIFLKDYLPEFRNAYNALPYETILSQSYKKQEYEFLLPIYASILCIHYINKVYVHSTQFNKFKFLIDNMSYNIGLIDGVVAEIAKYSFFNERPLDNNIQKMLNNFIKKGKNIIHNSWNAVYDIHFFRTCAMSEQNSYKSNFSNLECWQLTNDEGLKYLSHIIQFNKNNPGEIISIRPENELLSSYINECHAYQAYISWHRELLITKLKISDREIARKAILKTKNFIQFLENKF
ncbi:hypothetical protein [Rickettsia endosymbiont of Halotydeus destructor]|uniref:hypothetical protein n=1 Tax=Rickettsia endosymbiont of Halotydeus destructor TaxID=2996754 RepID=UPI003BAF697A